MSEDTLFRSATKAMTFIDLCAGIGGISLGLERAGMECTGQVEYDDFCNRILARHWSDVPRFGDITEIDPACLPAADLVAGGYPCQPFSLAGERRGAADDRHLWPYVREIVAHIRPTWCLFENVAGHVTLGLDEVLAALESLGYTCGPLVIPACAVDAAHRRDRVWLLAHSESTGERREERNVCEAHGRQGGALLFEPDSTGEGYGEIHPYAHGHAGSEERHLAAIADRPGQPGGVPAAAGSDWPAEPSVGRVADGVPRRVDRLRGLGNAVVPQVVEVIGRAILAAEEAYR